MTQAKWAIILSVLATILGMFGGVPGIKELFFSEPSLEVVGLMPVVVFDEGYSKESEFPKFTLKALIKINNPNKQDISINELKVYGIAEDTSSLRYKDGSPAVYKLNLVGTIDDGNDIVKSHSSNFLKFNIAHFENELGPGAMRGPMKLSENSKYGHPTFYVFIPRFSQLFKYNNMRIPYNLVDEIYKGELSFALNFNNKLIKIPSADIYRLYHTDNDGWENEDVLYKLFNSGKEI